MRCTRSAFTLVELSIVLVILGLLVGGVLAGQSLIRSAELRNITKEKDQYVVALNAFKDKYFALPGDMANAYSFWGATCGTNTNTVVTGCNGNGNGRIWNQEEGENIKVWEHFSLAGLIEGSFDASGADAGPGVGEVATSTNIPKSRFPSGFWDLNQDSQNAAGSNVNQKLFLRIGTLASTPADPSIGYGLPNLTHAEAWNIDTKVDDGAANTGTLRGDTADSCYDSGTDYYMLTAAGADYQGDCILHFILQ